MYLENSEIPPESYDSASVWGLDQLRTLHLEMGVQCNARCSMCFQTDFSPSNVMPESIWKEKLQLVYSTARELLIIGGEPTVLANCRQLLEMVMKDFPSLDLITATNGIRFNGLWEDAFLRQGKVVNFSVIAIDPVRYERIVKYGNQALVLENLQHLIRRKRETGSKVAIRMNTVITDDTLDELSDFFEWGAIHGVDQVSLDPDCVGRVRRQPKEVQRHIAQTYEMAERHPQTVLLRLKDFDRMYALRHGIPPVKEGGNSGHASAPCGEAFHTLLVTSDGLAKPCCLSWYAYGNLRIHDVEAIWSGGAAQRFRQRIGRCDYRDCFIGCTYNPFPVGPYTSLFRHGLSAFRRNPRTAIKKISHKLKRSLFCSLS